MRLLESIALFLVAFESSVECFSSTKPFHGRPVAFQPVRTLGLSVPAQTKPSRRNMAESSLESPSSVSPDPLPEEPDQNEPPESEDPIELLIAELRQLDLNELINTVALAGISALVLWKLGTVDAHMSRGWTAEEIAARIPLDVWAGYSQILANSPISTKAVTSASVYTIGDIIAQRAEGNSIGQLDRMRIARSLLAGLIGHGPLSHVWYNLCDNIFDNILHWTEWWSFIPKVLLDQATWGPFWNNTYILLLGLMKFDSWETMWGDMKRTTVPLIISGLKLWPLAHCITYGLISVENRLLWVDLVEIIWVTILATTASAAAHAHAEDATEPKATD